MKKAFWTRIMFLLPPPSKAAPIPYSPLPISFTNSAVYVRLGYGCLPPKSGRTIVLTQLLFSRNKFSTYVGTDGAKKSLPKHNEIHLFQECFEFIPSQSSVMIQGSLVLLRPILLPVPVPLYHRSYQKDKTTSLQFQKNMFLDLSLLSLW